MEEKTKHKIKQAEIIAAVLLLFVGFAFLFQKPTVTGHVTAKINTQPLDITIEKSQIYSISTKSKESFIISSIKLSGEVIGDGQAKIYINNGEQNLLVYSNIIEKSHGFDSITGLGKITGNVVSIEREEDSNKEDEKRLILKPIADLKESMLDVLKEYETIKSGEFIDACVDTCFIEMEMASDLSYKLIFVVENNTKIRLNKITFTIME